MDAETGESLAFVNIILNNSHQGVATDIDGKFVIRSSTKASYLELTYVGYEKQLYHLSEETQGLRIFLKKIICLSRLHLPIMQSRS